jgi:cobalt-zinc-cadmium efflux system outer membrane protein
MKHFARFAVFMMLATVAPLSTASAESFFTDAPASDAPMLTLDDLQRMALENNPAIAEAAALIDSARGRELQAGLYPNPVVGYSGDDITPNQRGGKHGVYFTQTIVTADKLGLNRAISAKDRMSAEAAAAGERQRVVGAVTQLYYDLLIARRTVEIFDEFARLSAEMRASTLERYRSRLADEAEMLRTRAHERTGALAVADARDRASSVWRQLAATVGRPDLAPRRVAGSLEQTPPVIDGAITLERILGESPEVAVAEAARARAEAQLRLAEAARIPDLQLIGGVVYNWEPQQNGAQIGPQGTLTVGVEVPIFDRNQGEIASARARLLGAQREVRRVKLSLTSRFAAVFAAYQISARAVSEYQQSIIPDTRRAFDLFVDRFRRQKAPYADVQHAREALLDAQEAYLDHYRTMWSAIVQMRHMLVSSGNTGDFGN